ncbi:unnamed protein product [Adineta steineri]|uniref:F-box domain-containing protein n=1 Tax=Adineta steineri TaxID=433720 RepID=A0A814E0J0_9BILA|nr:unnamed protein product [Adineta steineri]CAF0957091.1 unnamed protein product [Adineta steineri]CAF0962138.1 unnamed protein product [Adineta steineri]
MEKLIKPFKKLTNIKNLFRRRSPKITWEHSWSSDEIKNALENSHFRVLPTEVILQIFKFLSVHDLGNVSLVCRRFKMVADHDEIWKLKCQSSTKLYSKSFKKIYMDWIYEKYLRNIEIEKVEGYYHKYGYPTCCMSHFRPPVHPVRSSGEHDFVSIGGFKQHPNKSQNMMIELSFDVNKTVHELISLYKKRSKLQAEWRQAPVIKQMITRYYHFIQLKALYPSDILLIPTLDIEIIWQTHLLRPKMYREDCIRLFHRVIDHSLLANEIEQFLKEQAFNETCKLYEERFHEPYCPLPDRKNKKAVEAKYCHPTMGSLECIIPIYSYWDETHVTFSSTNHDDDNPFSFTETDVILDGNWFDLLQQYMKEMISKVQIYSDYELGKHIDLSEAAIKRLKKSYERFLYMAAKYPSTNRYNFVHSTYAIDIIWYSHMQEPLKYASDCIRLVNYIIDHTPWISADGNITKSICDDIANIWKNEFDNDMETDHLYNTTGDDFGYSDDND